MPKPTALNDVLLSKVALDAILTYPGVVLTVGVNANVPLKTA
jgi:hypothetical protein